MFLCFSLPCYTQFKQVAILQRFLYSLLQQLKHFWMFHVLTRILTKAFFTNDFFLSMASQVEIQFDIFKYTLENEN